MSETLPLDVPSEMAAISIDLLASTTTSFVIDAPRLTVTVPFMLKDVVTCAKPDSLRNSESRWSSRSGGWAASVRCLVSCPLTSASCLVSVFICDTVLSRVFLVSS